MGWCFPLLLRVPVGSSVVPLDASECGWQPLCPGEAHTLGGPGLDADVAVSVLGWASFELSMGPWARRLRTMGRGVALCLWVFLFLLTLWGSCWEWVWWAGLHGRSLNSYNF